MTDEQKNDETKQASDAKQEAKPGALAKVEAPKSEEVEAWELIQRKAKMLSVAPLVPKEYQGNLANCIIAINIATRINADPLMVMCNLDVIHGRPSWRATFLIATVNGCGRFTPLRPRY